MVNLVGFREGLVSFLHYTIEIIEQFRKKCTGFGTTDIGCSRKKPSPTIAGDGFLNYSLFGSNLIR